MLKYINYQLHPDPEQQAQLEVLLSARIRDNFSANVQAFADHIPSVVPLFQQHDIEKYSIFCTSRGEINIVDFANGRVWYGESPYNDARAEVNQFCLQASCLDLNALRTGKTEVYSDIEPLPEVIELLVMFGLGLGHQLAELLKKTTIKHLIIYEPNLDVLLCSVQANDWQKVFELAAAKGTQLYLQLGCDGSALPDDLKELQQVTELQRVYLYRHYFHPVMDKVYSTICTKPQTILRTGQHFGEFDSFYDYLPERAGNTLGILPLSPFIDDDSQSLLQKNLAALQRHYPEVYHAVKQHKCRHWSLVADENEQPNLQHQVRKGLFYQNITRDSARLIDNFVHHPYKDDVILGYEVSPKLVSYLHTRFTHKVREQVQIAFQNKSCLPEEVDSLIIFGVALGKHIEILTQRHQIKNLYICEPNLDFFVHSLSVTDWFAIFERAAAADSRIYLNLGGDGTNYFQDLMLQFYKVGAYSIANTYMLSTYYNKEMQKAIYDLRTQLKIVLTMGEYFDHVRFGIAHTYFNVNQHRFLRKNALTVTDATALPVFIVANGPSLDACFEYLHKYRDQVILISCGTALRALHRNGIQPDFHAEVEQNRATYDWITQVQDPAYLKGIRLISVNGMHPDTASLFKETLLAFKQGESSTYVFQNALAAQGAEFASLAYSYPTVTNMVVNFVLSSGFKLLYLFGVDLGYADINYHHSKFSAYYRQDGKDTHDYKNLFGGSAFMVEGNFLPVVFTQPAFDVSRKLVEQALASFSGKVEIYNCSNGVKIAGAAALAPEFILLADNQTPDKSRLLEQFVEDAFYPILGNAQEVFSQFNLNDIAQSVDRWLALMEDEVSSQVQAKAVIEAQWQHLRQTSACSSDLTFYLFYGSANYFLGLLTKLMAGIDENPQLIVAFNKALQLWRDYLREAKQEYLAAPLRADQVDVSCLFK